MKTQNQIPATLFKYKAFDDAYPQRSERIFKMLEDNIIYFSSARSQNDQFECLLDFDYLSKIKNDPELRKLYLQNIIEVMISKFPGSKFAKQQSANLLTKILEKKGSTKEFPDIDFDDQDEVMAQVQKMFKDENMFKDMESPIRSFLDFTKNNNENVGILSLSETNTSQVMWAMYANKCNGICLEFEPPKERIYKVKYTDERSNDYIYTILAVLIDFYFGAAFGSKKAMDKAAEQIINLYTMKSKEWEFEREWRIIGKAKDYYTVPEIKCVYIGNKVSQRNIKIIEKICARKGIPVKYLKNDYQKFAITFKDYL